ncbi:MAG: hypothetical protein JOZ69_12825, partial [Myxococcales bacterium]|nr:hypothetical protein [Myxococcales bacterium]
MPPGPTPSRDVPREAPRLAALRVARWLLDKDRAADAVSLLAAWAANGPNDADGQNLLAEALRVDPSSRLAKLAFERMEGVAPAAQSPLDEAIARWSADELRKLEREIVRPSFFRAQVGFNNNVKYKNRTFHIQTEDSGLDKPHVITHLFADGGRVIKSHKRSYAEHTAREDVALFVRKLMKGQQLEMALGLREGKFDEIIEGRAVGGMEVLDYPPKVDVQKLATQKKSRVLADGEDMTAEKARPSSAPPPAAAPAPVEPPPPRPRIRLIVIRSLRGGPIVYEPVESEAIIGGAGSIVLPGESFCHPREAAIRFRDGRVWLFDFEAGN